MSRIALSYVASFLALVAIFYHTPSARADTETHYTYQERALGSEDAPVTVVEYSSVLCNHCADFHADVLPEIKKAYIDTGKVRWVFADHSLGQPYALAGAMILRCAPAEKSYDMRNMIMSHAMTWIQASDPLTSLKSYVALGGMTEEEVNRCLASPDILKGIRAGEETASKLGITSTPSFIIDGGEIVRGGRTFAEFQKIIDPLLAKKQK